MGHYSLLNYIDDLIYTAFLPSTIHNSHQFLLDLLQQLGLDVSSKKLHPHPLKPYAWAYCLTQSLGLFLYLKKNCKKLVIYVKIGQNKTTCTKNNLQSLLGSLLYVSKCVKPARVFLNRMLQVLRDQAHKSIITVPTSFFRDLQWFKTFLTQYSGVTMYEVRHIAAEIFLPKNFMNYNIAQLEILNIVVVLKVWSRNWANKRIQIFFDNRAVVDTLNSGRAKDETLATNNINYLSFVWY